MRGNGEWCHNLTKSVKTNKNTMKQSIFFNYIKTSGRFLSPQRGVVCIVATTFSMTHQWMWQSLSFTACCLQNNITKYPWYQNNTIDKWYIELNCLIYWLATPNKIFSFFNITSALIDIIDILTFVSLSACRLAVAPAKIWFSNVECTNVP